MLKLKSNTKTMLNLSYMLDQEDLRNIKDLLESTVSASEARLRKEIKASEFKLRAEIKEVKDDLADLSSDVAAALEVTNNVVEQKAKQEVKKHEKRFHSLKAQAA